jgi:hypothetical protein
METSDGRITSIMASSKACIEDFDPSYFKDEEEL